ncbi:hypothetical protein HG442_001130, partial [Candidatus Gracilibacteria bacterium]|nr:hypothetical protein [Candidatus Gracilibacteria bacterium]
NSSRKILFFGEKNPPTYHEVPPENEKLYQQILQTKQQISDEQRFENIIALNAYQEHLLAEKNIGVLGQDHDASRKLVAYYRGCQMTYESAFRTQELMHFLRYFVERGYSQIFDEFAVLYRFAQVDFLQDFAQNSYRVDGDDFRTLSSIFADTIHFSNGTPENFPGTLAILGTQAYSRHRGRYESERIHLPICTETCLRYEKKAKTILDQKIRKNHEEKVWKNLKGTLRITLETIEKSEKILLSWTQK